MHATLRTVGRIIFALPFGVFGLFHLLMGKNMVAVVPTFLPYALFWVYAIGVCLLAACIAIAANRFARPAALCLAALLATFIITVHIPGLSGPAMQMAMTSLLKDFALMGGALMVAGNSQ